MSRFIDIARMFLESVASETDTYTSVKAKVVTNLNGSVTLETPSHLQFAYAGRGPGKAPPLDSMLEYIRSKSILFDGMSERGTAFAIQRSIAKNGTKNYKPNAENILEKSVRRHQLVYQVMLSKDILSNFKVVIDREIGDMYKDSDNFKKFKI